MRALIATLLIFTCTYANAQLTIAVTGGTNNNTIKHFTTKGHQVGGDGGAKGWQAGVHAEYARKHWFGYAGAELSKNSFFSGYVNLSVPFAYTGGDTLLHYNPLYLNLPAGIGYKLSFNKMLELKLFGGLFGAHGLGGNIKKDVWPLHACGDFTACPEEAPVTTKEKIKYGKGANDDMSKDYAGLQFGAAIKAFNRVSVSGVYNMALSDISLTAFNNPRFKLNTWQVNALVDIIAIKHLHLFEHR